MATIGPPAGGKQGAGQHGRQQGVAWRTRCRNGSRHCGAAPARPISARPARRGPPWSGPCRCHSRPNRIFIWPRSIMTWCAWRASKCRDWRDGVVCTHAAADDDVAILRPLRARRACNMWCRHSRCATSAQSPCRQLTASMSPPTRRRHRWQCDMTASTPPSTTTFSPMEIAPLTVSAPSMRAFSATSIRPLISHRHDARGNLDRAVHLSRSYADFGGCCR